MSLFIVPCTLKEANAFVRVHHRHNEPVIGTRLTFAAADELGVIRGVVLIGRPVSRHLDDGWTLEINRLCTDGYPNAGSFLCGAAWNAVKSIGYQRLITYTLPDEGGSSLKAVGWKNEVRHIGHQWNCQSRPRKEQELYLLDKYRWEVSRGEKLPFKERSLPGVLMNEVDLWTEVH